MRKEGNDAGLEDAPIRISPQKQKYWFLVQEKKKKKLWIAFGHCIAGSSSYF